MPDIELGCETSTFLLRNKSQSFLSGVALILSKLKFALQKKNCFLLIK